MISFNHQFTIFTAPLNMDMGLAYRDKGSGCGCEDAPLKLCKTCLMKAFPDIKPLIGLPFRSMLFSTSSYGCVVKSVGPSSPAVLKSALSRWCSSFPRKWLDGIAGLEMYVNVSRTDVEVVLNLLRGMASSIFSPNSLVEQYADERSKIKSHYNGRLQSSSFPVPAGYEVFLHVYWVRPTSRWPLKLEFQVKRIDKNKSLLSVSEAHILARHVSLLLHGYCQIAGVNTLPLHSEGKRIQEGEALIVHGSGVPMPSDYLIMASLLAESVADKGIMTLDDCRKALILASGRPVANDSRLRQLISYGAFKHIKGQCGAYKPSVLINDVLRHSGLNESEERVPVKHLPEFRNTLLNGVSNLNMRGINDGKT